MMTARSTPPYRLVALRPEGANTWLDPAVHTYVTAMDYPRGTEAHRTPLWREHISRPGWHGVAALSEVSSIEALRPSISRLRVDDMAGGDREVLVGVAYGYHGARDQWWNQQLRSGLRRSGRTAAEIEAVTADYFELTELHVHPMAQGAGLGEQLLRALLADRPEPLVLLSTPEVENERNRAWSLYRRLGFFDVLRGFTFVGDPRPFAFLGRSLPCRTEDPSSPLAR